MRRIIKLLTSRLMIVAPLVMLQLTVLLGLFYRAVLFYRIMPVIQLLAIGMVIYVINRNEDPSYKIAWCCVILGAPVIGVPLYVLAGNRKVPRKIRYGTIRASQKMNDLLDSDPDVLQKTDNYDLEVQNIFQYGMIGNGFPVYGNTRSKYYSSGEEWFPEYLEELKKAEKFILMEFFIINEGSCLNELLDVLEKKIREGVKVILIYDDFGCVTLPRRIFRRMRDIGMELWRFNRLRAAFIIQMNNRDHRKITVVDNRVAFTGGVNLGDEYANRITRYGYWRDSAVRIEGDAVWSFTVMFLGMYSYLKGNEEIDFEQFRLHYPVSDDDGLYQPYSDSPTDNEPVALSMHLNMIQHARNYIYMDTPYLILNESIRHALILAAKSGVDVRILTPHIPDKLLVFQITKGNYYELLRGGVKIYEYTPGFNHCKNFVSDDRLAIVGTTNMDYRSYFLHFENGVLMYRTKEIAAMKKGFTDALKVSHEVTLEEMDRTALPVKLIRAVLNLFVPLV